MNTRIKLIIVLFCLLMSVRCFQLASEAEDYCNDQTKIHESYRQFVICGENYEY